MRPLGSAQKLAERRIRTVYNIEQGVWTVKEASEYIKVAVRTIYEWLKRYREEGESSLEARKAPGRVPALSERQLKKLERTLLKGAAAYGFESDLWTCPRVVIVIEELFDISYHPDHVWKILSRKLGWSPQKPERQAIERNTEEVAHWKRYKWRELKKKPRRIAQQ